MRFVPFPAWRWPCISTTHELGTNWPWARTDLNPATDGGLPSSKLEMQKCFCHISRFSEVQKKLRFFWKRKNDTAWYQLLSLQRGVPLRIFRIEKTMLFSQLVSRFLMLLTPSNMRLPDMQCGVSTRHTASRCHFSRGNQLAATVTTSLRSTEPGAGAIRFVLTGCKQQQQLQGLTTTLNE